MPPDTGVAFVVAMHLSPTHESHLAELLQSHCPMPVRQVTEALEIQPDHIYVIPPNANLSAIDTHLRLSELEPARSARAPIEREVRSEGGRTYVARILPYRASDDRIEGVVITFFDVTERRAAQEAQRKSEASFHDLVAQVKDYAIFRIDLEGRALTWNEGVQRLFGFTEDEFIGKDTAELYFTPEDRAAGAPQAELSEAAEKGTALSDRWLLRKDGRRLFAQGTTTAIRDAQGRVTGFTKVKRDHTRLREVKDADRILSAFERLKTDPPETHEAEYRIIRAGEVRWLRTIGQVERPRHQGQPGATRVIGTLLDITDLKRREEHLRLVMVELNHRVKNTLAVVQATAEQALRHAHNPEHFVRSFGARLRALSEAHTLLTRSDWQGAALQDLFHIELGPGRENGHRVEVSGPGLVANPDTAMALHMIIHELTTNATKHGALSTVNGRVSIQWRLDDSDSGPLLRIEWRESGGPRCRVPSRPGFGSSMLERTVRYQLGGEISSEFPSCGFRCSIRIPWDHARAALEGAPSCSRIAEDREGPATGPSPLILGREGTRWGEEALWASSRV